MPASCPQCHSPKTKVIEDNTLKFIQCLRCGYDELDEEETLPHLRSTQREKTKFNPYKSGRKRKK